MTVKDLVGLWQNHAHGTLAKDSYRVHLTVEDAARIDALHELYPKRTKEQLIGELLGAALSELEASFPYVQGAEVISTDEMGDPIYADVGMTPSFIHLTKKHLHRHQTNGS